MASSTLAAPPFLPTIPAPNPSKQVSVRTSVRRLPVAASAAPSGAAAAARERRRFLERYGLNPDDFEDEAEEEPRAHFVEMDPWVISEVLKPNLECTGFLDVSQIHMLRVEKILANAEKSQGKYPSFDYISVTPPYLEVNYSTLLDQLSRSPLVGKDCFILVEYPLKTDMAESCGNLIKIADRRFGRTNLLIYGPTWSEKKRRT